MPLVQVSLYGNEDPDQHYRLGEALQALRDENVVIIGAGASVHNLRDLFKRWGNPTPYPYAESFDEALREAAEAPAAERQARMAELVRRPDARKAHPVSLRRHPPCPAPKLTGLTPGRRWSTCCPSTSRRARPATTPESASTR